MVSLNVFKFPPGKEPSKTVDDGADGKKTLSEVGDNPISAKVRAHHAPYLCFCVSIFAPESSKQGRSPQTSKQA